MENIEHRLIPVNGLQMHVAEVGEGPLVLFIHGFPKLWYSWRHQMTFVAAQGYHAVAPDMRGYGETTGARLDDPSKFAIMHLVGDLIALLNAVAPNEEKVFVVGHDWGANVAWHLAMYRPDRVRALVNLSVPFFPGNPEANPVEAFRKLYGDDHYICRFQEPGDIEAEFKKVGTKEVLKNILSYREPAPLFFPKGKGFIYSTDRAPWLTEDDLDYYVTRFDKTGFTGGVNYYRVFVLNCELNAPWSGAGVTVPSKFITGEFDPTYHLPGTKDFIHGGGFKQFVPLLEDVVVLEGAAHFINQERPDEINQHIYDFIKQFETK
ncbi:epoxide hydrolase A-like [Salvia splendens]|uniref:epoxide hydrolase A-like n=1 Tax=Salvia splendens TaxID=180675 RepID=UPI001C27DD32|nr:epoxide hydrolase A-like [Salvia splendens]